MAAAGEAGISESTIGGSLRTPTQIWGSAAFATMVLAFDLNASRSAGSELLSRGAVAALGVGSLWLVARRDSASLGLQLHPQQGWTYWVVVAAVAVGVILALSVPYVLFVSSIGELVELGRNVLASPFERFAFACVQAPLVEEALYRVLLCASFVKLIGPKATVMVSGVIFAALHVIYGTQGPDNAVAGFVLGWAYLRSGSVLVPVFMHAGGNALVLLVELAAVRFA